MLVLYSEWPAAVKPLAMGRRADSRGWSTFGWNRRESARARPWGETGASAPQETYMRSLYRCAEDKRRRRAYADFGHTSR